MGYVINQELLPKHDYFHTIFNIVKLHKEYKFCARRFSTKAEYYFKYFKKFVEYTCTTRFQLYFMLHANIMRDFHTCLPERWIYSNIYCDILPEEDFKNILNINKIWLIHFGLLPPSRTGLNESYLSTSVPELPQVLR